MRIFGIFLLAAGMGAGFIYLLDWSAVPYKIRSASSSAIVAELTRDQGANSDTQEYLDWLIQRAKNELQQEPDIPRSDKAVFANDEFWSDLKLKRSSDFQKFGKEIDRFFSKNLETLSHDELVALYKFRNSPAEKKLSVINSVTHDKIFWSDMRERVYHLAREYAKQGMGENK